MCLICLTSQLFVLSPFPPHFRVSVVTALSEDMVSVRYVDYGDIGLIPVDRVRYLDPKFSVIPALAIRAKLHGMYE